MFLAIQVAEVMGRGLLAIEWLTTYSNHRACIVHRTSNGWRSQIESAFRLL
jgi:hypothetical protein